jgi:hypothetical protein
MATSNEDLNLPGIDGGLMSLVSGNEGLSDQASDFRDAYKDDGIPVSDLNEYADHEDTYTDSHAMEFKARYSAHDNRAYRIHVLEFACLAIDVTVRANYGDSRPSSEQLWGDYCLHGNGRADTVKPSPNPIRKNDLSLIVRLVNVAYCKQFPGDSGARIFKTLPRGPITFCCPNCETRFRGSGYIEDLGRGTKGWDNMAATGDPNRPAQ